MHTFRSILLDFAGTLLICEKNYAELFAIFCLLVHRIVFYQVVLKVT